MSTQIHRDVRHSLGERDDFAVEDYKGRSAKITEFTLVIPALNEADALPLTLDRALAARRTVVEKTPIERMDVVLVNDGSTDATQAIAERYSGIKTIHFEKNCGYGAAIKAGFRTTNADLIGFMDADGTCDPGFCVELINALVREQADVAVGSRMDRESEMPLVRRFGNFVFARLIGAISGKKLTDCASGMRVLRRSALRKLHPLPDGLHFTPAMTCLALLNPQLRITEVPMPYKERVGHSKLRVVRDGFKFLFTILFTAALFNPIKSLASFGTLFLLLGLVTCVIAASLGAEWLVLYTWLGAFLVVMFQAVFIGFLSHQLLHVLLGPWRLSGFGESLLQKYMCTKLMIRTAVVILAVGVACFALQFALPKPWNLIAAFSGALIVIFAGWLALAGVILRVTWTANERRNAEREDPFAISRK